MATLGSVFRKDPGNEPPAPYILRDEFDGYDGDRSKYIVILDDEYPIATCRFYELDEKTVLLGRVVVLPEYRGKHLGSRVINEAEK